MMNFFDKTEYDIKFGHDCNQLVITKLPPEDIMAGHWEIRGLPDSDDHGAVMSFYASDTELLNMCAELLKFISERMNK